MSDQPKVIEFPPKPQGQNGEPLFDNRVRIVNEKTGNLIRMQPYELHVFGDNKETLHERPPGSGNMWDAVGRPVGNWKLDTTDKARSGHWVKVSDTHAVVKETPLNRHEALEQERDEALAELAAIKSELAGKMNLHPQKRKE